MKVVDALVPNKHQATSNRNAGSIVTATHSIGENSGGWHPVGGSPSRSNNPANTQRNKHVIITSKLRFDVMIACLLCCVFTGLTIHDHHGKNGMMVHHPNIQK